MDSFTAALRDALLVADTTASEDQVRQVVINQVRELDPQARLRSTGYFNHSWVPDLSMSWADGSRRHLFLRFNVSDPSFVEDLRYADTETDPVFLDIAQPELALEGQRLEREQQNGALDIGDVDAMVAFHTAWQTLGAGVEHDPGLRSATKQIVRGGRGVVDQPTAERVIGSYDHAATLLAPERVRETDPGELRAVLDELELPLGRIAKLDLETDLRERWVTGGRQPEIFPSLEGWQLNDRLPEEIATLVFALLQSEDVVPDDRWREISRAISLDALGAASNGRQRVTGGKLNDLVRVARDNWTARWAWVPAYGDAAPQRGHLDWSLGGLSLELNLDSHRAVFVDKGNRFNTLPKPESLPLLEPRLDALEDSAVKGISISSTEETVAVYLTASATETLGERLRRLMAQQADVRISGRIESLEIQVPGSNLLAEISFSSGRVRAEAPIPIASFARLIAQFVVGLSPERLAKLDEKLTESSGSTRGGSSTRGG